MTNKKEEVTTSSFIGIEQWADGAIYEGNYKKGMKNGTGKFSWTDGSSYEGEFKNNLFEGKGISIM